MILLGVAVVVKQFPANETFGPVISGIPPVPFHIAEAVRAHGIPHLFPLNGGGGAEASQKELAESGGFPFQTGIRK
jgi:hypothetical protein